MAFIGSCCCPQKMSLVLMSKFFFLFFLLLLCLFSLCSFILCYGGNVFVFCSFLDKNCYNNDKPSYCDITKNSAPEIMVDNVVTVVKLCLQKIIQQYFYVTFQDFFLEKTVGIRLMVIQLCRMKMASLVKCY